MNPGIDVALGVKRSLGTDFEESTEDGDHDSVAVALETQPRRDARKIERSEPLLRFTEGLITPGGAGSLFVELGDGNFGVSIDVGTFIEGALALQRFDGEDHTGRLAALGTVALRELVQDVDDAACRCVHETLRQLVFSPVTIATCVTIVPRIAVSVAVPISAVLDTLARIACAGAVGESDGNAIL